jgi:hypothetical protein
MGIGAIILLFLTKPKRDANSKEINARMYGKNK